MAGGTEEGTDTTTSTTTSTTTATPTTTDATTSTTGSTTDPGSESSTGTSSSTSSTGGSGTSGSESGESSTGGEPADPLVWGTSCLVAGGDLTNLNPRLECTAIDVPLEWSDPEGQQITIAAVRVPTLAENRLGTVWMLDGGPGGSGLGFVSDQATVSWLNGAGWDVAVPTHRGAISPMLSCSAPPGSAACRLELDGQWGEGLASFNTVNASHDVGEFIARAKSDDDGRMLVYGVSYGSYWGHHYLGLYPNQADGVVLDSVLRAGVHVVGQYIEDHERGIDLLDRCLADPGCAPDETFVSGDVFSAAIIDQWDNFNCGGADIGTWGDANMRFILGGLVNTSVARNYFPLLATLLAQCDPAATQLVTTSINGIYNAVFSQSGAPPNPLPFPARWMPRRPDGSEYGVPGNLFYNQILFPLIVGTSVLADDVDATEGGETAARHLVSLGFEDGIAEASFYQDLPNPEFDPTFAAQTPTLIMQGAYDLQTPLIWAEEANAFLDAQLFVFDDGSHGIVGPGRRGSDPTGMPCSTAMVLAFGEDPESPVDGSCIDSVPALDLSLQRADLRAISLQVFGTEDPWSLVP